MIENRLKKLLQLAADYCSVQERAISQVKNKLLSLKAAPEDIEQLIDELIREGFLNEDRFAQEFVSGKFRNNRWGKIKIRYELKKYRIDEATINRGLETLDSEEYYQTLQNLIRKKHQGIKEKNRYAAQKKVATFVISKGYEPDLVWEIIKQTIK